MLVPTFPTRVRDWVPTFPTRVQDVGTRRLETTSRTLESLMPPPMTMDRAYDIMEVHHKNILDIIDSYKRQYETAKKELQHYKERNEAKANDLKRALMIAKEFPFEVPAVSSPIFPSPYLAKSGWRKMSKQAKVASVKEYFRKSIPVPPITKLIYSL
ncbi:hypothetical protein CDAR_463981 [Caerostris darwini]|uniref:Uncharacterized protein n=1 Tax=Caerostris darwini TaxID=1538125 RepID=A0AAV4VTW1_9ARAC|nr:hypothetical protein CDAR_463981 [Caerostris darwini]